MTQEAATKTRMVDPNMVPRPYPGRTELLPAGRFTPDAQWLGSLMANKYPGVVAEKLEVVQLFDSHTTKLRVAVDWNEAGKAAGLPRNLCVKANWSGMFDDVDIHALALELEGGELASLRMLSASPRIRSAITSNSLPGSVMPSSRLP